MVKDADLRSSLDRGVPSTSLVSSTAAGTGVLRSGLYANKAEFF